MDSSLERYAVTTTCHGPGTTVSLPLTQEDDAVWKGFQFSAGFLVLPFIPRPTQALWTRRERWIQLVTKSEQTHSLFRQFECSPTVLLIDISAMSHFFALFTENTTRRRFILLSCLPTVCPSETTEIGFLASCAGLVVDDEEVAALEMEDDDKDEEEEEEGEEEEEEEEEEDAANCR